MTDPTFKHTPRAIIKGTPTVIDAEKHIYELIGTAEIIDDEGDKLSVDDIWEQHTMMKAIGGGAIILTYGHTDMPCARSVEDELVTIRDPKTNELVKATRLRYQIVGDPHTVKLIVKAHDLDLIKGASIRGIAVEEQPRCADEQCTTTYNYVSKGNYYSYALHTDPHNRLSLRLDQAGAPEIVKGDIDPEDCVWCLESKDYYMEHGMSKEDVEIQIKGLLKGEPVTENIKSETEDTTMEIKEVKEIVKAEVDPLMERMEGIQESLKAFTDIIKGYSEKMDKPKEEITEPVKKEEPVEKGPDMADEIKKAIEPLMVRIDGLENELKKAKEPVGGDEGNVDVGDDEGVTDPVGNGVKDLKKGASQKDLPGEDAITYEQVAEERNKFTGV